MSPKPKYAYVVVAYKNHLKRESFIIIRFASHLFRDFILLFVSVLTVSHGESTCENTPIQYTVRFQGCKNDYFQMKKCYFSYFCSKHSGGSNEYP